MGFVAISIYIYCSVNRQKVTIGEAERERSLEREGEREKKIVVGTNRHF